MKVSSQQPMATRMQYTSVSLWQHAHDTSRHYQPQEKAAGSAMTINQEKGAPLSSLSGLIGCSHDKEQ